MDYKTIILLAAKKASVSGSLLLAICTHESGLKNIMVKSDGGSPTYGICQIKQETAKMQGWTGEAKLLMNPRTNAKYAALYLKFQLDRYEGDEIKAVSAYNAGRYNESHISPGNPRNLRYVNNVMRLAGDL